jgi:hypothetical protein
LVFALSKIIVSVKFGASFSSQPLQAIKIFILSSFLSSSFFQNRAARRLFPFWSLSLFVSSNPLSSILILKKFIFFARKTAKINTNQIATIQTIFKVLVLCFFPIFVLLKLITFVNKMDFRSIVLS